MDESIQNLHSRVFSDKTAGNILTDLVALMRDLGGLGDVLGRTYEVSDDKGVIKYHIRQRPIEVRQLNILLEELNRIHKREEKEMRRMRRK